MITIIEFVAKLIKGVIRFLIFPMGLENIIDDFWRSDESSELSEEGQWLIRKLYESSDSLALLATIVWIVILIISMAYIEGWLRSL